MATKSSIFLYKSLTMAFSWLLGFIFIFAGLTKLMGPQDFADSIAKYEMVPLVLVSSLAVSLPIFEIIVGAGLLIGCKRTHFACFTIGLLIIFLFALFQAYFRGLDVSCSCFGYISDESTLDIILRDIVMLILAFLVCRWSGKQSLISDQEETPLFFTRL